MYRHDIHSEHTNGQKGEHLVLRLDSVVLLEGSLIVRYMYNIYNIAHTDIFALWREILIIT